MLRRLFGLAVFAAGAVASYRLVIAPWWRSWGVDPVEAVRALPGDEVVPDGVTAENRGITIDAPPAAVWPWLVQMGYGRGGWYSYDQLDMRGASADRIVPELQSLAVGDIMPTHPAGGFVVTAIEPERSLVLFTDTATVREQAKAAADADPMPANLKLAGAFMEGAQPTDFAASWAFVLEPLPDGRTRLIERSRVRFGAADKPWMRLTMPLMGFGVFVMMRRQLIGIRDRAERTPMPAPQFVAA
jgi:hypothetical protein